MLRSLGLLTLALAVSLPLPAAGAGDPRVWNGLDPFHAPVATTDFYGSGDVNLDGRVTAADVSRAKEMAQRLAVPSYRADADLDGDVDAKDVELLRQAARGRGLPAQWDLLATRAQREAQITRILARDRTSEHPWAYWFQSLTATIQHFLRAVFYHGDLVRTVYDGGPTLFNVPVYVVLVTPAGSPFSYIFNGVLVGDDPLDLADWIFIDPTIDQRVHPGDSGMPFGSDVRITVPTEIYTGGFSSGPDLLRFAISGTGEATLLRADAELVRVRQPLSPHPIDNRTDLLRPRIVPASPPLLVFERMSDAIPSTVDVHLSDFPPAGLRPGVPLTRSRERTRLLDVSRGPDGTIHMLFSAERLFVPGVFYARLDPTGRQIERLQRIARGVRLARRGRVMATAEGEIHAFWLEVGTHVSHPHEPGIYWSRRDHSGSWGPAVELAPEGAAREDWFVNDIDPDSAVFDVTSLGGSGLALVWVEPQRYSDGGRRENLLASRLYRDGVWEERTVIDEGHFFGVHLVTGSEGEIHLFDWAHRRSVFNETGPLRHRSSADGAAWTVPVSLDSSGTAAFASAAAGPDGRLDLAWERTAPNGVKRVIRRRFANGQWEPSQVLAGGAEKPAVAALPDGSVGIVWSVPGPSGTSIGSARVAGPP